jgi:hypothetical protein
MAACCASLLSDIPTACTLCFLMIFPCMPIRKLCRERRLQRYTGNYAVRFACRKCTCDNSAKTACMTTNSGKDFITSVQ